MVWNVHEKVKKRVKTEVEKIRKALDGTETMELKKENIRITVYKD